MSLSRSQRLRASLSTACLSVTTTFASAQTANTVLLEAPDKSVSVSGELVEAKNGIYQLSTTAGLLSLGVNAVNCSGQACPTIVPVFEPGAEVELSSNDGAVNITGNITDIVDGQYVVDSPVLGSLQIAVDLVDCSGPGCPTAQRFAEDSPEIDTARNDSTENDVAEIDSVENNSGEVDLAEKAIPATSVASPAITDSETPSYDPANADISFAGSDTVGLSLLPYLLEDYADTLNVNAESDNISETESVVRYIGSDDSELLNIYVNATGSGDAVDALASRSAMLGMTSRPLENDEARQLIATGSSNLLNSDYETVIAVDSLALVTHPTNPISSLSIEQIAAIYLGEIDNWSQVGGPSAPITVLSRDDGSSTRGVFENAIFGGEDVALADSVVYPGGDNPEMAAAIKADPLAIGYVSFAFSENLKRLDLTSECGITSAPTTFAVKTEEYPLGRRLYLYNREDNTPNAAQDFLDYVLSPDADDAIARSNFVNFAVESSPQSASRRERLFDGLNSEPERRLANLMSEELNLWDRLSTTVRFRFGSSVLGNKERNDLTRLISKLSEMPQNTRIAVVGFTDNVGAFENNRALSEQRAESVADAIRSLAGELASRFEVETRAYSELSPSVCNADAISRAINRRVEIWVSK